MNEAVAEPRATRLGGVVGALDRFFPVLWIGLYLLLPVSGWATEMFESWNDQRRDLEALQSLLADGHAAAIAGGGIGPAYIGAAALVHEVLRLSPEDSLVMLTRASYALSIAAALVLVRVLVSRSLRAATPMVSLVAQLFLVGFVFAAGTWYWSDVPWSHFLAAFLAVAVYAARFAPARPSPTTAAFVGALVALLAATRSFELLAVVLAWGIAAVVFPALRLSRPAWSLRRSLVGATAFVATTGAVYAATGIRHLFFLYGNSLDTQSGSLTGGNVGKTPTLSLAFLPTKLVQLFVDPCYLSLCRVSNYETHGGSGTNLDLWSLPLAVQLPALAFLPICIVVVAALVVRAFRRRRTSSTNFALRPLAEMTIAATGLVVGYAASTLTGPAHLRYGFARDFLLPALLTAIVLAVLFAWGSWNVLERRAREGRASREPRFVVAAVVLMLGVVAVANVARYEGLPRIESRHVATVEYSATCLEQTCHVRLEATTPSGRPIAIPEQSTLTFGCGSDRAQLTRYVAGLGDAIRIDPTCAEPRLVAAWPTVMGLPPGSYELAAVSVRNV